MRRVKNTTPVSQMVTISGSEIQPRTIINAIEMLDDRSRHILESRWLTEDKLTLHELAEEYGVSAERIRQIEANAIKKIRATMEA